MKRDSRVLVMVVVFLMVFGWVCVEGGRILRSKEKVAEPENFTGSYGGTLPGPITGTFQSPGFSGTFPSPGFGATFPSPGLGGTLPSPGFAGTFPSPTGVGFGSSFCSFPGVRCPPPASLGSP